MKKLRKVTSLLICAVMLMCMLSIGVSAKSITSNPVTIKSSFYQDADAVARLEVVSKNANASTSYEALATSMAINLNIEVYNSSLGKTYTDYNTETLENCGSILKSVNAGTNETFLSAMSYHNVATAWDGDTITLSVSAS